MSNERTIHWLNDIAEAKKAASSSGKPVLMFFHYTHCNGCINTFGKTLTKTSVIDAVTEAFVPVVIEITEKPRDAETHNILWTPTFIVADEHGNEVSRWEGYLPEDDFLGQLDISLGRHSLKKGNYLNAEIHFDEVIMKYPLTDLAPQAMYYHGVAKYRATGDAFWLTNAYDNLVATYPDSQWRLKASVWSRESMARKVA